MKDRFGYIATAGMHRASSAVLACAESGNRKLAQSALREKNLSVFDPSRFRSLHNELTSALLEGVCPDRKLGPEEKSHKSHTSGVVAAGNVVRHS